MRITLEQTIEILQGRGDFLVLCHANPDGDTIGSGIALCRALHRMGKRAKIACGDPIPANYHYLLQSFREEEFSPETILAVDVADVKLLGSLQEAYKDKVLLAIDHHPSNLLYAENTLLRETAAATCEIIYDLITGMGIELDKDIANALYTGISTDTGCFKFANTTAKTHYTAGKLMEAGADYGYINQELFDTVTKGRLLLEKMALESMEFHFDDRCALICISRAMREKSGVMDGDIEGITALPRKVEGVLAGITLREKEGGYYKISVRTRDPVNAGNICFRLSGGGHMHAAGCELYAADSAEAKRIILQSVEKELSEDVCRG